MSFLWPLALLALLAVPLVLVAHLLLQRRRAKYAVRFTNVDVLASVLERGDRWRRWIAPALFLLALTCVGVALARPQVTRTVKRVRALVVLVIDSSGSMRARDVKPTRFEAAGSAVRTFLRKVPARYEVALVGFSEEPQVVASPTLDRQLVREGLFYLYPGRGTAIGDALATATDLGRAAFPPDEEGTAEAKGDAAPVAIVFLSDGMQMGGQLLPLEGARLARRAGIPVYTIALGTANGVVTFNRGYGPVEIPVPPDPVTLRQIARVTGGRFYEAFDAEQLSGIYSELGSRIGRTRAKEEVTFAFAGGAAFLLLVSGALSALRAQRLP